MRPCTLALLLAALVLGGCRSNPAARPPDSYVLDDGRRLSVRFEGSSQFSAARLRAVVDPDFESSARRSSIRASVDDAAFSTEVFYRNNGFPACQVDYRIEDPGEGPLFAVLNIVEGPRVRISGARFQGNESISSEELSSFVLLPGRMFLPDPKQWYVAREVENSRAAIESYYKSRGFLSVLVTVLAPLPRPEVWEPEATVEISVEEGPLYELRSFEVTGGVPELNSRLDPSGHVGRVVTLRLPGLLRSRLREIYAENGYPDADVQIAERRLDGAGFMDLHLEIEPGPLVVLGEIRVEGHERTREARIRGNLAMHSGEPFDVRNQRKSFENLYQLGVFGTVAIELEGSGAERDLLVRLEESPSREFYFEPGYGSYEQLRMVLGWRENNLAGRAQSLDVEGTISQKSIRGKVSLTNPRFRDSGTASNLTLFGGRREEPSFERGEVGGLVSLTREIQEQLQVGIGYQYRFTEITADDFTDPDVQPALDSANVSSILLTPTWDTRDSAFYPSSGQQARLALEYSNQAIGSELDFVSTRWALAHYLPELGGLALGLSLRGGLIVPFGNTTVIPVQERFFNGGENTVRSFREDQLGPKDSGGNPVGGEGFNVFTAELRAPLTGRFQGALFYDAGNVVGQVRDYLDFGDIRSGLGVGLRYALPVGPVRLDAGWNPDARPEEADYVLHLSVGFSF